MKILKLGQKVRDSITKVEGVLTIFTIDCGKNKNYLFQPRGLNPDNGFPLDTYWVTKNRVIPFDSEELLYDNIKMPTEILHTLVYDKITTFAGIAIGLTYYLNGCIHVDIKPRTLSPNGNSIEAKECDFRRLEGEAITTMTEKEHTKSIQEAPSPEVKPSHLKR